ncbi:O-antigen ligase family protein [Rhodopila sp.]|uniref:O-antigen ligase family protein n=1 Tax=Rhodopila sp. TaxID=2480087 RepID=UPI003D0C7B37
MPGTTESRPISMLERTALVGVMLLPLLLLHAHGIAEVAIAVVDLCFLARSTMTRDWAWLGTRWLWFATAWWGWLVFCSLPISGTTLGEGGPRSLLQALMTVRFLLLVAALEWFVLRTAAARLWIWRLVAASAAWIVLNSVIQDIFGRNLLGLPPAGEGVLTGPFGKARAGPPMARIIIPAVLPPAANLLQRRDKAATAAAYALLLGSVVIMVLIGQRMPLMLTLFGLLIVAVLIRRLRPLVLTAAIAGALLLAASPVVAPSAYFRLVEKFSAQMEHFAVSPYGQLYTRAWQVGLNHPFTGMGFDGFATGCPRPANFRPSFDGSEPNGGGAKICWDHPHNYWLQALDDGGFIGLALFGAMAVAWLLPLGRGLWLDPEPRRVALFAAIFIQLWPIQSTTAFTSMPVGGWFFLLLGWAMAESRAQPRS